jgi:hypothetical protein
MRVAEARSISARRRRTFPCNSLIALGSAAVTHLAVIGSSFLLMLAVYAIGAPRCGSNCAVMPGIVAGDTANDGSLDAACRICPGANGRDTKYRRESQSRADENFVHMCLPLEEGTRFCRNGSVEKPGKV